LTPTENFLHIYHSMRDQESHDKFYKDQIDLQKELDKHQFYGDEEREIARRHLKAVQKRAQMTPEERKKELDEHLRTARESAELTEKRHAERLKSDPEYASMVRDRLMIPHSFQPKPHPAQSHPRY